MGRAGEQEGVGAREAGAEWMVGFLRLIPGPKPLHRHSGPCLLPFCIGAGARDQEADESHRSRGWGLRRSAAAAGRPAGAGREQRRRQCLGGPSFSRQLAAWAGQPCSHPQLVGSLGARPVHPLHQPVGLPTCQPQVSVLPCLVPRLATHTPRALLGDIGAVNGQACEAAGGARDEGGRGGCQRWQCSSAATAGAVQTRATAGAAHRPWWGPGAVPRAPRLAHKRRRAKQAGKTSR